MEDDPDRHGPRPPSFDGASLWTRYWRLTLPLCRPALAATGHPWLTTWIYNDFFWAITLISTR